MTDKDSAMTDRDFTMTDENAKNSLRRCLSAKECLSLIYWNKEEWP
jgi:hypothetical protein